jgi:hypothetical protein
MKGVNTLFNDIFIDKTEPEKQRKGRSESLYILRNECLLDRFFFYGKLTDKRYDVIVRTLSTEFFISEVTIPKVIDENYNKLATIKKQYKEMTPGTRA